MRITLNRLREFAGKRLFCIAHSDRPVSEPSLDLNNLEARYRSPIRLPPPTPFRELRHAREHSPYLGSVSLYDIGEDGTHPPTLVCAFRPGSYKPQHALWTGERLWVLGTDHIDVYDPDLRPVMTITDPWLAGGHTIAADGRGHLLVSCSASDSALTVDEATGAVTNAQRLPEALYGFNYPLGREDSVVEHYIVNDYQITHVNCAWSWRGGVLVSSLIPGAVGWFGADDRYRELASGFIGCHGARVRTDFEEIFFCDSCTGTIVFLDPDGRIVRRVGTKSRWLHDAVQIAGDLFAAARFDYNDVLLLNVMTRQVVGRIECPAGEAPQFLSFGVQRAEFDGALGEGMEGRSTADGRSEQRAAAQATVLAALRRQQAEMAGARDALIAQHAEEQRAHDATTAHFVEEIARRDAIIAGLHIEQGREVSKRDVMLAMQMEEIASRDRTIATLRDQIVKLGGARR